MLNFDVYIPDSNSRCGAVEYYRDSVYVGDSYPDTNCFRYTTDNLGPTEEYRLRIATTTYEQVKQARERVEEAKRDLEYAQSSMPYAFRDLLG